MASLLHNLHILGNMCFGGYEPPKHLNKCNKYFANHHTSKLKIKRFLKNHPNIHQFYTKLRPSPFRKPFNCFFKWLKLKLCERKEKVNRSAGYIQTRASTGLVVNHCTAAMAPKDNSHVVWHVIPKHFFLSPIVLELRPKICYNGRQTNTIRKLLAGQL